MSQRDIVHHSDLSLKLNITITSNPHFLSIGSNLPQLGSSMIASPTSIENLPRSSRRACNCRRREETLCFVWGLSRSNPSVATSRSEELIDHFWSLNDELRGLLSSGEAQNLQLGLVVHLIDHVARLVTDITDEKWLGLILDEMIWELVE